MSDGPEVTAAVGRGARLFNRGRYFTAQQLFEEAWQAAAGPERTFLEALVQLAAGMHLRTRRGATQGAEHLLVRALITLEDWKPAAYGVDVARLTDEFDAYVRWLREVRRPHRLLDRLRIPRLHTVA
jgi:predicted metal-dependent hydrolase